MLLDSGHLLLQFCGDLWVILNYVDVLVGVVLQVVQLSCRSILFDLAVFDIAVHLARERESSWSTETVIADVLVFESTAALITDVHPVILSQSQMSFSEGCDE
jgi:hypothetical protein